MSYWEYAHRFSLKVPVNDYDSCPNSSSSRKFLHLLHFSWVICIFLNGVVVVVNDL